jgi:tetratricopeptide (TPR) repeat protein
VVLVWILLIVLFLVIWQVLQPATPPDPDAATASPSFWTGTGRTLLPMAVFAPLFLAFLWATRTAQSAFSQGARSVAEGEYANAEQVYLGLARKMWWFPPYAGFAQYNLGVARLERGDLSGASDALAKVATRSLTTRALAPGAACHLALIYALRGEIAAATRWIEEARHLMAKTATAPGISVMVPFAEAVIDVREGRGQEALRRLDENAKQLDGTFTMKWSRRVRALRALATERIVTAREAGAVDAIVNALLPAAPNEFLLLTVEWPEMQTFLTMRGLVRPSSDGS